jgi:hypothetical protein
VATVKKSRTVLQDDDEDARKRLSGKTAVNLSVDGQEVFPCPMEKLTHANEQQSMVSSMDAMHGFIIFQYS